jgi:hypothetical protein
MQTTYRLNTSEIDLNFFEAFKKLWSNKEVIITVQEENSIVDQKTIWTQMEAVRKKYPPFIVAKNINLSELANEVNL